MRGVRVTASIASALATAAVVVTVVPASPGMAAAAFECRAGATAGVPENQWLGGTGSWSDAGQWSLNEVPGVGSRGYACIPPGSEVVVDGATPRVGLKVLELGRGARLTLTPDTAMYLWGSPSRIRSVTRPDSVLEVDGATLGGLGRLRVMGTLSIHRSVGGDPALLTSRPLASTVSNDRAGILEVGDHATLRVTGNGNVRIARRYVVDVRGRTVLREDGGLKADHGTSFLLQRRFHSPGVGRLVILNDRGFAEGFWNGIKDLASFVNRGIIIKRVATGTSTINARYLSGGKVVEESGNILLPPPATETTPGTGPCGNADFCNDEQDVTVKIPVTDANGAEVDISPLAASQVKGSIGVPLRIHATDLQASVADPVVLRLRYAVSALRRVGAPADPARLDVARAENPDDPYVDIPACVGHEIPLGKEACLDVASSARTTGGGVLLVVRTVALSRWVAR